MSELPTKSVHLVVLEEDNMKRITFSLLTTLVLLTSAFGCATKTGSAVAGAAGGVAAGGGAYEYRINSEMNRLNDDLKAGKIDQKEYDIRKDELQRLSILK